MPAGPRTRPDHKAGLCVHGAHVVQVLALQQRQRSFDMCSRTTLSTKSLFAAPPLPAWKQSSDPANKLTIGESHVVLFTPYMSAQPHMYSHSRSHSNCVSSSSTRPPQVCKCPVTVRPDRGWGGYREFFSSDSMSIRLATPRGQANGHVRVLFLRQHARLSKFPATRRTAAGWRVVFFRVVVLVVLGRGCRD